jgi:retron-type reverse transcriptase
LGEFGTDWHWRNRRALIAAIIASPQLEKAWSGPPRPRIVQPCMASPTWSPLPQALECALPDLPTTAALSAWLGVRPESLDDVVRSLRYRDKREPECFGHYTYRWMEKRSGGFRLLEIPKTRLRTLQSRILRDVLEYVPPHPAAHGFRVGRSCLTHALEHVGREVVIRMDLADFFLSLRGGRVLALFRTLGYPDETAAWLTALCTNRVPPRLLRLPESRSNGIGQSKEFLLRQAYRTDHLPQGAPTSPALANLCAFRLDMRLEALTEYSGGRYTRYADDLTFSGGRDFARGAERFVCKVAAVAAEEGLVVNLRKTRIMRRGMRQRVTGIVVNEKANLPREQFDKLKAILHNCLATGPAGQTDMSLTDFRNRLSGQIAHAGFVHPARGRRLRAMLEAIDWEAGGRQNVDG